MSKQVTIAGFEFTVSAPYSVGQVMSDAEAAALNQVRAENIGNNFRATINKAKTVTTDEDGNETETISDEAMAELITALAARDSEYVFNMASVRAAKATLSPLEKESIVVAKAILSGLLAGAGKTAKEYGKENCDAKIAEFAASDDVIKQAAKRIKERAVSAEGRSL